MTSEVKIRNSDFMENQSENESLRAKIREVEDENQELRAQNLIQNRTISEMRNEIVLLRIQMHEMSDTSALLTERVRVLTQNLQQQQTQPESDNRLRQITTPPLMAPPPVPPPLPPSRIRISPRQVGAGEALTTPLGISLSSPPRHRVKRDCRQGFCRSSRPSFRRSDTSEPGPSTPAPYLSQDRPNYFVGLRIIPQFHTSFVCTQNNSSSFSESASDSSGSDENPQVLNNVLAKVSDGESACKRATLTKDFEFFKNVRNLHNQKVRQTILHNYNLSTQNTNGRFFFPLPWERKNNENPTMPSTSRDEVRFFQPDSSTNEQAHTSGAILRNLSKLSDCAQYTFPTIHEGLHHNGTQPITTNNGQNLRLRKLKKNIPYIKPEGVKIHDESRDRFDNDEDVVRFVNEKNRKNLEMSNGQGLDSESYSSVDEARRPDMSSTIFFHEFSSDFDQDGFQADESSNCTTSTENSLEKICISESSFERKN